MRIPLIAGNWKMNTTLSEAIKLVNDMRPGLDEIDGVDKVICPPFISLAPLKELAKGSTLKLGAQNLFFAERGAYTGEISPLMLAGVCEFVIIGHSERRQYFGETDEMTNKKVRAALKVGLKPILCVGEKLEEKEAKRTKEVVIKQLRSALATVDRPNGLVIAYEPVWAIGTNRAATGEESNETIHLIRQNLAQLYSTEMAQQVRILYGGSVAASNIAEFMQQPEIDGALVGGASLKAKEFVSIVKQTEETFFPPPVIGGRGEGEEF